MQYVFDTDLHAFAVYPASHIKPEENPWGTNREIQREHYQQHVHPNAPLQFELPRYLPPVITASPYDQPDTLMPEQAAARLFGPEQQDFAAAADHAARHYLGIPWDAKHKHFTHLHGIGSWENSLEPSMVSLFHRPVTPVQLQKIAATIGSHARQHGILMFSPHPEGAEQMLHMRLRTHSPAIQKLSPGLVADITRNITDEFNKYYDPIVGRGGEGHYPEYHIPGRTILPDTTGHTDILAYIAPYQNANKVIQSFHKIGDTLGGKIRYWSGTGKLIGGTHPYSDEETNYMSDKQKREAAEANYRRAMQSTEPTTRLHPEDVELPPAVPAEPKQFAMHSPAKTGIVVRGVFYRPGSVIPDLITPGGKEPVKMSCAGFREKLKAHLLKKKGNSHADDDSPRTGGHGGIAARSDASGSR